MVDGRTLRSVAGTTSFGLSFLTAIAFASVLVIVDQFNRQQIRTGYEGGPDAPIVAILFLLILLFAALANLGAVGLGLAGIFYGGYGRIFAVFGLVIGVGVLWVAYHQQVFCLPPMCLPNDTDFDTQLINYPDLF